jgi:pyruvate dehydrogenase E2 component (dihydrolipoamide acetyltransferase)
MTGIAAITMPKWGLTMTEGKILGWLKEPGAAIGPGDELLEIETSKITNVMEAGESGVLRRIVAAEGATLPVGALIAVVAPADVPESEIDAFVAGFEIAAPAEDEAAAGAAPAPREIQAGGRRLRILELGEGGTPVVLIHGFGADLNTWMFTQPVLAERRRTIAFDLPGHGGSDKALAGADAGAFAAVVGDLFDALGLERACLVGHSLGGAVALAFARARPQRVAGLVLIAAAGLGPEIDGAFIDGFVAAQRRREAQEVLRRLVHDPQLVSRAMVEDVLRYKRLDGVGPALEAIAAAWFPGGRQAVALDPAGLAMPVLLIWGREDRIVPAAHAEALAGRLPVAILDGAGHLPHMEKSGEVNRLLARFLDGAPPPSQ